MLQRRDKETLSARSPGGGCWGEHPFLCASASPPQAAQLLGQASLDKKAIGMGGSKREGCWGQKRVGGCIIGRAGFSLQKSWRSWGSQEMPENPILVQALPPLRKQNEALARLSLRSSTRLTTRGMFLPTSVSREGRAGLSLASSELCSCLPLCSVSLPCTQVLGRRSLRLKKTIRWHHRPSPNSWGSSSHPESES